MNDLAVLFEICAMKYGSDPFVHGENHLGRLWMEVREEMFPGAR